MPDVDAARLRRDEAGLQELGRLAVQADVVQGELEAPLGRSQERHHLARDILRALTSVAVGAELDQALAARIEALYALFAAWYS